jgi:hypothetical protein
VSRIAPKWVSLGVGIALVAAIVGGILSRYATFQPKVVIGKHDEIYYYRRATREDALALGHALQSTGFFNDRGTSVLLWMGGGPTIVSFIVSDGAWDRPNTISNYTEIGRRVAASVGGFPIQVHLVDAGRVVRKKMNVGKTVIGAKDVVYYFGDATDLEARTLGEALRSTGYFTDKGVSVSVLNGEGTVLSFVVQDGLWDSPAALATLDRLVRQVAPAAGGLPIKLRMLDRNMAVKQELMVQ